MPYGPYRNPFFHGETRADGYEPLLPGELRDSLGRSANPVFTGLNIDVRNVSVLIGGVPVMVQPGVVGATDRVNNQIVMQAAVRQAVEAGLPLFIPPIRIEMASDTAPTIEGRNVVLEACANLTIIGCGARRTVLHFGPKDGGPANTAFLAIRAVADLRIEGVTLQGPTTQPDFDPKDPAKFQTRCVQHTNGAGDIRLYDVRITGWFHVAIDSTSGGGGLLDIAECDFRSFAVTIGVWSSKAAGKRVHIRSSTIRLTNPCETDTDGNPQPHLLYLAPAVSVDIRDCELGGPSENFGKGHYGVHHATSGWTTARTGARYVRIVRSRFRNLVTGILTSGGGELVEVHDCEFHTNRGIDLRNSLTGSDCRFLGCDSGVGVFSNGSPGCRILLRDCKFHDAKGVALTTSSGFASMIESEWLVEKCEFRASAGYSGPLVSHVFAANDADGNADPARSTLHLASCTFRATGTEEAGPPFIDANKRLIVEDSTFTSRLKMVGVSMTGTPEQEAHLFRITLRRNKFALHGSHALSGINVPNSVAPGNPSPAVYVDGSDNTTNGSAFYLILHERQAGGLLARSANYATTVTPDGTGDLHLSWDYDRYDCAGGTLRHLAIHPAGGSAAFGGHIDLRLLGALTITAGSDPAGDNIAHSGSHAAGEILRLVHDPYTQLWYVVPI